MQRKPKETVTLNIKNKIIQLICHSLICYDVEHVY